MASDLLALLDTLDGLHGQATPVVDGGIDRGDGYLVPADNDIRDYLWFKAGEATTPEDMEFVMALAVAYPRLAQALRTALTPTTDGERSVRTMFEHLFGGECGARVDVRDEDGDQLYVDARCIRCKGHDGAHDHLTPDYSVVDIAFGLRTALALLATERAKAADAARERDELRAQLAALRSVPDGVIRNVGDGRAVFSITLTTPPPHIGPDPVDVTARTRTLTPKVTP